MSMYEKNAPYVIEIKAGNTAYICQCGLSATPPYCDGSHQHKPGSGPLTHEAKEDTTLYVCGCGKSANMPFCDGSHSR